MKEKITESWNKFKGWKFFTKFLLVLAALLGIGLIGLIGYRAIFLTFVDNYEFVYRFDARTGEITYPGRSGYIYATPFLESIHTIDLRPIQVCISGSLPAGKRITNCKLVQFNPEGLAQFLEWHGRGDYGAAALEPILMAYAFEQTGTTYAFMTIKKELRTQETVK